MLQSLPIVYAGLARRAVPPADPDRLLPGWLLPRPAGGIYQHAGIAPNVPILEALGIRPVIMLGIALWYARFYAARLKYVARGRSGLPTAL